MLQGCSLGISPGEVVALVGASGAGKSTIAMLLLGFHRPKTGHCRINGIDIHTIAEGALRRHMAVVEQHPFLFHTTVAENIRMGVPHDPERLISAAKQASAFDFIQGLPKGFDTNIEEGGMRLSGGQQQRICIARAFYRDAPFLLLDEPTTSLDAENVREVMDALLRLMDQRTVLMITHSERLVSSAHRVLALQDGKIVPFLPVVDLVDTPHETLP